jgi:hypothetical protein
VKKEEANSDDDDDHKPIFKKTPASKTDKVIWFFFFFITCVPFLKVKIFGLAFHKGVGFIIFVQSLWLADRQK